MAASVLCSTKKALADAILLDNFLLIYKKLDKNAVHFRLCIDACFLDLHTKYSQISFCTYLAHRSNNVNIVHQISLHATCRGNLVD